MAVYLNIGEVRAALSGPVTDPLAAASQPICARLFHEVLGGLVERDAQLGWLTMLAEEDLSLERWQERLVAHTYRRLVGPRLTLHAAALDPVAGEVCLMWEALQNLCHWVIDGLWARYRTRGAALDPSILVRNGLPREVELHEPGWSDTVRVTDIEQSLWSLPGAPPGCAIELRIGPEALGEGLEHACLYHLLLSAAEATAGHGKATKHGAFTLVSFTPVRTEAVFDSARLELANGALKRLIGQLAGVVPAAVPAVVPETDQSGARPDYTHLARVVLEILREHGIETRLAAPPLAQQRSVQLEIALPTVLSSAHIERLSEEIKARLRLKVPPRLFAFAGRLILTVEFRTRPIVFFWPRSWSSSTE